MDAMVRKCGSIGGLARGEHDINISGVPRRSFLFSGKSMEHTSPEKQGATDDEKEV